jgi:ubiquinone/menaquinone biosynthesis C-methylase UbiE
MTDSQPAIESESEHLRSLYGARFSDEAESRDEIWQVLCHDFFQKWVPPDATVLDVAAGHCEFINNIKAGRRLALDLNPDVAVRAARGVETFVAASDRMTGVADASVDIAFVSNFFEHIPRETILTTLAEIRRVLRPTGRLLILQPNVRYCARDYWQFFDHITPVDDRALAEALVSQGFEVTQCLPRFLPYTTKSRLPTAQPLVRLYLKVPLAWRVLGKQAFVVASPSPSGS